MSYRCEFCQAVVPNGQKLLKVTTYRDRIVPTTELGPNGYPVVATMISGKEIVTEKPACFDCYIAVRHGTPVTHLRPKEIVIPHLNPTVVESHPLDF